MGQFYKVILLALLMASCGVKKKRTTIIKEKEVSNTIKKEIKEVITVKNDTSVFYMDITTLTIKALDSTKPVQIIDSKGNKTTFYNTASLTTIKDKSVLKKAINDSSSTTTSATVGTTLTIEKEEITKDKFKIDFNFAIIGVIVAFIILLRLRKFLFI